MALVAGGMPGGVPTATAPERSRPRPAVKMRETGRDRMVLLGIYAFLTLIAVLILFPILYIVAASFSSAAAVIDDKVWVWPVGFNLDTYRAVFDYPGVWQAYLNSIIYTGFGTVLSVTLSVLLGYPLSRPTFRGRRLLSFLVLFAFLFNGGIVPLYLVVQDLGMINRGSPR